MKYIIIIEPANPWLTVGWNPYVSMDPPRIYCYFTWNRSGDSTDPSGSHYGAFPRYLTGILIAVVLPV